MKHFINTLNAPAVLGPYSQGVDLGNLVFTSGQIPIDPKTGFLIDIDISLQTQQVLDNIRYILESVDLSIKNIVKTTIFVKNLENIDLINAVYKKYFDNYQACLPVRSLVEVSRLPKDVMIEIEAIAVR